MLDMIGAGMNALFGQHQLPTKLKDSVSLSLSVHPN